MCKVSLTVLCLHLYFSKSNEFFQIKVCEIIMPPFFSENLCKLWQEIEGNYLSKLKEFFVKLRIERKESQISLKEVVFLILSVINHTFSSVEERAVCELKH